MPAAAMFSWIFNFCLICVHQGVSVDFSVSPGYNRVFNLSFSYNIGARFTGNDFGDVCQRPNGRPLAGLFDFVRVALGGIGIVIGLSTYGYKVIETIGKKITAITPTRGFAAEFSTATTVLIFSKLGLPISTTHTMVGSVIGIGFARGIATLNLHVIRNIITSWLITIPTAAILTVIIYEVILFIANL